MILVPKIMIHLGNSLSDIKPELKVVDLDEKDKAAGKERFQRIKEHLTQNQKYDMKALSAESKAFQGKSSKSSVLGGFLIFLIHNKKTKITMDFSVHLQKYNNGKYVISVNTGKDEDQFSEQYNPQSFQGNNFFLKRIVDEIFSSLEEASLLVMGANPDHRIIETDNMSGKTLGIMLGGTPYFKAKAPIEAHKEISDYASENDNVDFKDGVVTVQRYEITQFNIRDTAHTRNLFEVSQMVKGQEFPD